MLYFMKIEFIFQNMDYNYYNYFRESSQKQSQCCEKMLVFLICAESQVSSELSNICHFKPHLSFVYRKELLKKASKLF